MKRHSETLTRREILAQTARGGAIVALSGIVGLLGYRSIRRGACFTGLARSAEICRACVLRSECDDPVPEDTGKVKEI